MQEQRFYSVMKEQEYITCFVMNNSLATQLEVLLYAFVKLHI